MEVNIMTDQTKKLVSEAKSLEEKIKAANAILREGEPGNISVDNYSHFTGYKPQYIVDAMNIVFGIGGWGFEEMFADVLSNATEKGTQVLAVAKVKVWLKDVVSQPVGWGQSRVTKGDVGDAKKGAQTDALKKALSYFSVGNRAYHGLLKAA
jgi:recombination DNA repair RAD52 pathway protein